MPTHLMRAPPHLRTALGGMISRLYDPTRTPDDVTVTLKGSELLAALGTLSVSWFAGEASGTVIARQTPARLTEPEHMPVLMTGVSSVTLPEYRYPPAPSEVICSEGADCISDAFCTEVCPKVGLE